MALVVKLQNYAATRGRISRREIIKFVTDYAQRHEPLRRCRVLTISFSEDVIDDDSGLAVGGQQTGNHIWMATRGRNNRIMDETDYIITLAHEMYHWQEEKLLDRRASKARCKLYIHAENETEEEVRAVKASLVELALWQNQRLMRHTTRELWAVSLFSNPWKV